MSDTTTSGAGVATRHREVTRAVGVYVQHRPDQRWNGHWSAENRQQCDVCHVDWPCDAALLEARLAAADVVIAVVRGVVFPDTDRDDIFELRAALAAYDALTAPRQEGV